MMTAPAMAAERSKRGNGLPPLPGLYPGKVVAVEHPDSLVQGVFQREPIHKMFETGLARLTGARNSEEAWKRFFRPSDVVGIKVVPNGAPWVCSSPQVVNEIIIGLNQAVGIPLANIIVYDRYKEELEAAGIPNWLPSGVRTAWGSDRYTEDQTVVAGADSAGVHHYYDPGQYFSVSLPGERDSKSYASQFLSTGVTKIINLACLKDHAAAGVTLCLKNLSHGLFNNVNRSHPVPNTYITQFIPWAVLHELVKTKVALNIIDGIRGIYNGGPFSTGNGREKYLWEYKTLFFATDAVAADSIVWRIIDQKRASVGLPPTTAAGPNEFSGFVDPQPEYIEIAGQMGLGIWQPTKIAYDRYDARTGRKIKT
jgi:hypothetical protein